jgi:hypothetical protein
MNYDPSLEKLNFIEGVNFTKNDPCIWVVYPPGAAGDLMSAILLKHYSQPAADFFGIDDTGRVIFRDSNYKHFNQIKKLDTTIIDKVNQHIGNKNSNYSVTDLVIFSNHGHKLNTVTEILDFFPQAKIIRIIPKTSYEYNITTWLQFYKNENKLLPFAEQQNNYSPEMVVNHNVLNIWFGDMLNEKSFDQAYGQIVEFLGLPYKLVRHDFIKFWISKQHPIIQPELLKLSS